MNYEPKPEPISPMVRHDMAHMVEMTGQFIPVISDVIVVDADFYEAPAAERKE